MKIIALIFIFLSGFIPSAYAMKPTDKETCEIYGGIWYKGNASYPAICDLPTKDAGKTCDKNSDCESICIAVHYEGSPKEKRPTKMPKHGYCFERTKTTGNCFVYFDEEKVISNGGIVQGICED